MNGLKLFDKALLGKRIGGNGSIVGIDIIYIITGVFFGKMDYFTLYGVILFVNMLTTCILFHNFIISRGDMRLELNTEKIVYYPTTRLQYLLNKYAKTVIFLFIQLLITSFCLTLGYFGSIGQLPVVCIYGGLLTTMIGVLLTSGVAILVMHITPLGIYLSMFLFLPLSLCAGIFQQILEGKIYITGHLPITITLIVVITLVLWVLLLWLGTKLFEHIT